MNLCQELHRPKRRVKACQNELKNLRGEALRGWASFMEQRRPATVDYTGPSGRFIGMRDTDGTSKFLVDLPSIQPHDPLSLRWRSTLDETSSAVFIVFHPLPRHFCSVERLIKCTEWHAMIAT